MAALWSIRAEGFSDQVRTTGGLFVAEGLTYALIARSAAVGSITVGQLALYIQAVAAARLGILLFRNPDLLITYGSASVPAARGLRSSLARLPSGLAASAGAPVERRLPGRAIEFAGVSFRYPGEDLPLVLSELELTLEANRSHAIVGVNGAGKTTLLKLLCRFYDPTAGRVLVDGVDLNVGFGHLPSLDDRAALDKAAGKAGAQGVVDRLPGQWETPLARHLTGGADLSGGEWQRIALARAMMAAGGGAGLLILDEPTASLDARGEAEIFDRFLEITEGCTTLLVSHRFSTVRRAEVIHVLDSGRVVEEGSHAALMELGGRYARMFGLQAARFKVEAESVERAGSHE
jgi:ABC-type multidrug transport system fused ATPase/permease subunit